MTIRTVGLGLLLLVPVAGLYFSGFGEAAKYLGLGCFLALLLGLLARPVAPFALLLPFLYGAAALTAQSTDGVVALIVAIAAAVGAAGSLGLQRGLVALLGSALLGSFEPAELGEVLRRSTYMLAGVAYALLLVSTVLREVNVAGRAVRRPQAAVGYAALLAVLALVSWFAARVGHLAHAWWLPLAVIAVSEPVAARSAWRSLLRTAGVLCATLLLVGVVAAVELPVLRGALLAGLILAAVWQGSRHPTLLALLLTPVLVLLSTLDPPAVAPLASLSTALAAALPIFAVTCLGHFAFWTLRSDGGPAPA